MTDNRAAVDYTDIDRMDITLKVDNSTIAWDATAVMGAPTTMIGKAVSLSADDTVQLASDGEAIVGKLIQVFADGFCRVQVNGYAQLPAGASATVTRGTMIVGALGASSAKGYIRSAASGTAAELIKQAHRIVANGTTTAVWVKLN